MDWTDNVWCSIGTCVHTMHEYVGDHPFCRAHAAQARTFWEKQLELFEVE